MVEPALVGPHCGTGTQTRLGNMDRERARSSAGPCPAFSRPERGWVACRRRNPCNNSGGRPLHRVPRTTRRRACHGRIGVVRSTARQRFWQLLAAASPTNGLKKFFLRRSGARIRDHVRIRRGSYVFGREIILGEGVVLEPNVHIVCGHLEMGTECKIDSETVVYGEGSLIMADGSYVGPRAWIDCSASVRLGRDTGVGPGSMIFTHGVWLSYLEGNPRKLEEVTLGDKVWVPAGVTVLPGVTVGDEAMIGAGSVVSKDGSRVSPVTFSRPDGSSAAARLPAGTSSAQEANRKQG
ncbi:MAG: acyltransferase [Methanobacteriota archaeon]|nr:MAG: acyltransferase [Euryarchaeota archaeon]